MSDCIHEKTANTNGQPASKGSPNQICVENDTLDAIASIPESGINIICSERTGESRSQIPRRSNASKSSSPSINESDKEGATSKVISPTQQFDQNDSQFDMIAKSIQHLEDILVDVFQTAQGDTNDKERKLHAQEIAHMRNEISVLNNKNTKLESQLKAIGLEQSKAAVNSSSLSDENKRLKEKNCTLLTEHREIQQKMQTCDTQLKEVNNKTVKLNQEYLLSQERCSMLEREFDAIRKDNEKLHSQEYNHMEKYELLTKEKRDSIDKLEETLNAERRRVQEAFDEILTLKMTLGAVGTDMVNSRPPSPFEKVKKTPRQVKFKGEDDPLSNLFHVEEGIDMYCQRFYSTEAAYEYCAAIFSNDFEKAGAILDAKSARSRGYGAWQQSYKT